MVLNFLPMVPEGGTMGQQMDFFSSSSFFATNYWNRKLQAVQWLLLLFSTIQPWVGYITG